MRSFIRLAPRLAFTLWGLLFLGFVSSQGLALPAPKSKAKPKEPKPTASSMVDGEGNLPSPIKPLKPVAPEEMASRFFREALSAYGEWFDLGSYGRCWRPLGVDNEWMPYTVGFWAYSRYGWTWVSSEDFGGIVYHYGRWVRSVDKGWCWVPDLQWGAAWVSWRYGSDSIGWAPLPPSAEWNPATGISVWVDHNNDIGPDNYVFCSIADFNNEELHEVIFDPTENSRCFMHTINVTNISTYGKSVFCGGPAYNWVAARVKAKVPVIQVLKERSLIKFREQLNEAAEAAVSFRSVIKNDKLTLVAPEWGNLTDPRKADALGFTGEVDDAADKVKWVEGQVDASLASVENVREKATLPEVAVLNGWELVVGRERVLLRSKVAREVAGLSAANFPAAPFDPERDTPAAQ